MHAYMPTLGHAPLDGTTDAGHMGEDVDVMRRIRAGKAKLDEEETATLSRMLGLSER